MTGRIEFTVRGLNGLAALRPGCSPRVALHEDISAPQLPSVTGWLTWPDRDFHPAMLAPLQAHDRIPMGFPEGRKYAPWARKTQGHVKP